MEKSAINRGTIVAVFMLVVLVLVFILVPGTAAVKPTPTPIPTPIPPPTPTPLPTQLGVHDAFNLSPCWMKDEYNVIRLQTEDISLNETPGSEYPQDVVAVLKCRTTITNFTGSAITYSGSSGVSCRAYFIAGEIRATSLTTSWSQTISASGNAVLSCHFKRNTVN